MLRLLAAVLGCLIAVTPVSAQLSSGTGTSPTAKGTQGAKGVPTQNLKDAGRTFVVCRLLAVTGVTTEALGSMTCNKGGTDQAAATSYTVTAGKTFWLEAVFFNCVNATTATAPINCRLRVRAAATVSATSPVVAAGMTGVPIAATAALNNTGVAYTPSFPDGIEIGSGQQIGMSHVETSANSTIDATFTGFEY